MSESKIENELLDVAAKKKKVTGDRQKYLTNLMLKVTKLPDLEWEGISTEAQNWVNAGAEAYKGESEIPDFPDNVEDEVEPESDEEEKVIHRRVTIVADDDEETGDGPVDVADDSEVVVKPRRGRPPGTGKPAVKTQHKKTSASHELKRIVVTNPSISVTDLSEQLKFAGFTVTEVTVATMRSNVRDILRVLNELDLGKFTL